VRVGNGIWSVKPSPVSFDDEIGGLAGRPLGLTGGAIASDGPGYNGGCAQSGCIVTGYWQSNLAVPEPMSASLLVSGLLGTGLVWRFRRVPTRKVDEHAFAERDRPGWDLITRDADALSRAGAHTPSAAGRVLAPAPAESSHGSLSALDHRLPRTRREGARKSERG
jgi:hypothetical protein